MKAWAIGGLGFLLAICFVPGISGAAYGSRWALLSIALPAMLCLLDWRPFAAVHWIGAAFLSWVALAVLWAPDLCYALDSLWLWLLLGAAFVLGSMLGATLPQMVAGLGAGLILSAAVALMQWFGFDAIGQVSAPPGGLFANRNYLGELAALVLIGAVVFRQWWNVTAPAFLIVVTECRAAVLALLAAGLVWVWRRSPHGAIALVIAVVGVTATTLRPIDYETWSKTPYVGKEWLQKLDAKRVSAGERVEMWRDSLDGIKGLDWLVGNGTGSYRVLFPSHASRMDILRIRPAHAHSEPLEIVYEQGFLGLGLLVAFLVASLARARAQPGGAAILVAAIGISLVAFPLRNPATAVLVAFAAGCLADRRAQLRGALGGRGVELRAGDATASDRHPGGGQPVGEVGPAVSVQPGVPRFPGRADHRARAQHADRLGDCRAGAAVDR